MDTQRRVSLGLAGLLCLAGSTRGADTSETPAKPPIQLTDVSRRAGIDFRHTDGSSGQRYIVETVSAGLATFDYDGDGWVDILFLNGGVLRGASGPPASACRLYRNRGDWRFEDVTEKAGVTVPGYALGVAVADYDNDGRPDFYLNNFGTNILYHNEGNGVFRDVTARAGVGDEPHVGAGTCFLDIDRDGFLDLYVGHYVAFNYTNHHVVRFNGHPAYVGPLNYARTPSRLYRNRGDGTFQDVSVASGVAAHAGAAMGVVAGDFDGDGDTDLFVGNDETGNFLFVNDGKGHFEEAALAAGVAFDFSGRAHGTMGAECADYDNDGRFDLFVTSFQRESPVLFRNVGQGMFLDVSGPSGVTVGTAPLVTWGCGLPDLDNDGHRDVFMAAGHLQDNVALYDSTTRYAQQNQAMRNLGNGKFSNVTRQAGDGLEIELSSRGAAFDDLDNDGRVDVVVLNSRREPTVLRNVSPPGNHWLQVQLRGVRTNRDAVGSKVVVEAGGQRWIDEVRSGRGYQSHYGSRLYFGLGRRERVDRVEVHWLGGGVSVVRDSAVDRLLTIMEQDSPDPGLPTRGGAGH